MNLEVEERHGREHDWWMVREQGFGRVIAWFVDENNANEYVTLKTTRETGIR